MKLVTMLIALFFAGAVSAQTAPAAPETKAAPVCKTGKPCGNACIAQDKTCSLDTKAEPKKADAAKPAAKPETKAEPKKAEKVTVEAKKEPAKDVKKEPVKAVKVEAKKDAPKAETKVEAPKADTKAEAPKVEATKK
jgi:ribonuclease E